MQLCLIWDQHAAWELHPAPPVRSPYIQAKSMVLFPTVKKLEIHIDLFLW